MEVSRQLLEAIPGCNFTSDSSVIQASKKNLVNGKAEAADGVSLNFMDTNNLKSDTKKLCTNMSSFAVNTYMWDP